MEILVKIIKLILHIFILLLNKLFKKIINVPIQPSVFYEYYDAI